MRLLLNKTKELSAEAKVEVSEKAMALKRCRVTEMRWSRNADSRGSSLMVLRRRPSSWRNLIPLLLVGPYVSKASGMMVCEWSSAAHMISILLPALAPTLWMLRCSGTHEKFYMGAQHDSTHEKTILGTHDNFDKSALLAGRPFRLVACTRRREA